MKYIEIKLTKYRLFLTEEEITGLLAKNPDRWAEWIKRGKAFTRARQTKSRLNTKRGIDTWDT